MHDDGAATGGTAFSDGDELLFAVRDTTDSITYLGIMTTVGGDGLVLVMMKHLKSLLSLLTPLLQLKWQLWSRSLTDLPD